MEKKNEMVFLIGINGIKYDRKWHEGKKSGNGKLFLSNWTR